MKCDAVGHQYHLNWPFPPSGTAGYLQVQVHPTEQETINELQAIGFCSFDLSLLIDWEQLKRSS